MARIPTGTRKLKNGTFEKRFYMDGKRYSVYAKTTKELFEKEKEKRELIQDKSYRANKNLTLNQYYSEWKDRKRETIKPSTIIIYNGLYNNHLKPLLGNMKIVSLERRGLVQTFRKIKEQGATGKTVNRCIVLTKQILKDCVSDEIIKINPAANISRFKDDKKVSARETIHRALTLEEQETFFKYAQSNYYYECFLFLIKTGLRFGEVAALTWEDIDYKAGKIHINKTVSMNEDKEFIISTPKTKTSKRDIPLNDDLKMILSAARQKIVNTLGYEVIPKGSRIFQTIHNKTLKNPLLRYNIIRILKECEKDGFVIQRFSLHAFRDTFATRFIEAGGNPQTLKTILGHSSLSMTMDLYAHVMDDTKEKEVNLIKWNI